MRSSDYRACHLSPNKLYFSGQKQIKMCQNKWYTRRWRIYLLQKFYIIIHKTLDNVQLILMLISEIKIRVITAGLSWILILMEVVVWHKQKAMFFNLLLFRHILAVDIGCVNCLSGNMSSTLNMLFTLYDYELDSQLSDLPSAFNTLSGYRLSFTIEFYSFN